MEVGHEDQERICSSPPCARGEVCCSTGGDLQLTAVCQRRSLLLCRRGSAAHRRVPEEKSAALQEGICSSPPCARGEVCCSAGEDLQLTAVSQRRSLLLCRKFPGWGPTTQ
uniref:uncharacterized protein LOC124001845 n=1 Tax=Oncorhynchus gorbuscha TaxID=8017 RepID=UPI001EAF5429|nr:uncharacterized protein LOC124001845 [Oncorhynchus gorbuscha]XP_046164924.1 uncharacterized protein LOC124001845 [Oncorhynchus gorbuscha]